MLIKILHCKRKFQKLSRFCKENSSTRTSCDEEYAQEHANNIKTEEDSRRICRVCLKDGNISIYGDEMYDDISEDLSSFTGLEIRRDDTLPSYLCDSCNALLQGAILLRKTAQQSDGVLQGKSTSELLTDTDLQETNNEETSLQMPSTDNDDYMNLDDDIAYHYKILKEEIPKKYHCKRCDIYFVTFNALAEHRLSQEHENIRRTCSICNKSYSSLYFARHLAVHKMDTTYMCDICGKRFNMQGQFSRHRLTHFYDLPFKCSLCPYRGRFTESLKMHMKTHTGEKPYQCSQCAARFVNKSNLNKHALTHRGEHDFKCSSCERGFHRKRDLDQHFKVDHTGIKDHVCNLCGKAFGYRKQMMKHQLKVHKREKLKSGRVPLYLQVDNKLQQNHEYD